MIELVHAGEALLLHHKRLAVSRAAYGFLHQHDVLEHWERYNEVRLSREIDQMVVDTHELLRGYRELLDTDERFLLEDLRLPDDLQADFRLARNLFSIGLDDVGLFMAGRGLEGVLRRIAAKRKIVLESKGRTTPVSETDLHDH